MALPKEIQQLSDVLSSLPGIGPKLASRLALYLSINAKELSHSLSKFLIAAAENIKDCEICGNATNRDICDICSDEKRDKTLLMIVEDSLDLVNIESTSEYNGMYHVLGGVISPINAIGPDELRVVSLIKRLSQGDFIEVIFALNPNVEGEATSLYLKDEISRILGDLKLTRLAKGIPAGGDLEFMSGRTIMDSMRSRVVL